MDSRYKKRHRIPASCSVCRKRKSKCDRIKPICGSCRKKSIAHLCFYETEKPPSVQTKRRKSSIGDDEADQSGQPSQPASFQPQAPLQLPQPSIPVHFHHPQQLSQSHQQFIPPQHQQLHHLPPPNQQHVHHLQHLPTISSPRNSLPISLPQLPPQHDDPRFPLNQQGPKSGKVDQSPTVLTKSDHSEELKNTSNHSSVYDQSNNSTPSFYSSQSVNQHPDIHYFRAPSGFTVPQQQQQQAQHQHIQHQQIHQHHNTLAMPSAQPPFIPPDLQLNSHQSPPTPLSLSADRNETSAFNNHAEHPLNRNQSSNSNFQNHQPHATISQQPLDQLQNHLVSVAIGPQSILKVNPLDVIYLFSNASCTLLIEGPNWQQHGLFSYLGLTKCDPFIKFFRNFTISLFKSGEISQFLKHDTLSRKKKHSMRAGGISQRSTPNSDVGLAQSPNSIINNSKPDNDEARNDLEINLSQSRLNLNATAEIDSEEGDVLDEDALIVTKITNTSHTKNHDKDPDADIPKILPGLASLYNGKETRDEYYSIVEQAVLKILPNKKNLFALFCRFFKYVHPFVPVVDESSLMVDLSSIFSGTFPTLNNAYYTEILITSDNDLNIIGILLLVVRLAYLSLIHNDELNNICNEDEKSMVKDMKKYKTETYVNVVNICNSDYRTDTKSSFKLVQNLTLLHFYRLVSPSDSHGISGCDSQILFGTIVRHSFSIGLNRDPSTYSAQHSISKRAPLMKTWRLLWSYIVSQDAIIAMQNGTYLNIKSLEMCDVEAPQLESKTGLLQDLVPMFVEVCQLYRNLCNKIFNIQTKPKVIDILSETSRLEESFTKFFGKEFFKEYICKPFKGDPSRSYDIKSVEHEESYLKVIKFNLFIQMRTNLSTMYYMVAIHYEKEHDKSQSISMNAGIELFKIYIRSVVQLLYIMSYVLDNSVELFGKNYDYILTASNERAMIKAHSFLTAFFIRLLHHKRSLTIQLHQSKQSGSLKEESSTDASIESRLEVTDNLFRMVLIEAELFVGNFRRLSKTYVNSYRIYVLTYFVLKQCMENPNRFFDTIIADKFFHEGTNMIQFLTVSEIQSLCKLCEEFRLAKLELNRRHKSQSQNSYTSSTNDPTTMPTTGSEKNWLGLQTSNNNPSSANDAVNPGSDQSIPLQKPNLEDIRSSHRNASFGSDNDNHIIGNEDLLKLFSVYGDMDHSVWD